MSVTWPPLGVTQRLLDLQSTRSTLRSYSEGDFFTEQCLARYLTVRSAGYLEAVRDDVADQYCSNKASPQVVSRVRDNLRTGLGVSPGQLSAFVRSFDPGWAEELDALLDDEDGKIKSALGAMVKARKLIAHGDGETVTTSRALVWADVAEALGKWLVVRFDPR
jgi:hypothetical protein